MASDPEFGKEVRALLERKQLNPYSAALKSGFILTRQTVFHYSLGQLPKDPRPFLSFVRTIEPESEQQFRELLMARFAPA